MIKVESAGDFVASFKLEDGHYLIGLRTEELFGKEASRLVGLYNVCTHERDYIDPRRARLAWEAFYKITGYTVGEVMVELYAREIELNGIASPNLV